MDLSFIILWVLALAATLSLIAMAALAFLSFMKQNELARELSDIRIGMAEAFKHLDKPFGDTLAEQLDKDGIAWQTFERLEGQMQIDEFE